MNTKWTLGELSFQCEKCIPCFESGKERCRGCDLDFSVFNDPDSESEPESDLKPVQTRRKIRLIHKDGTIINAVLVNEDDYERNEAEIKREMLIEDAKEREALLAERIRLRDNMQSLFPLPYEQVQLSVSEVDNKLRELERMFAQVERWLDEIETVVQIAMRPKLSFLVNGMFLRYC